MRVPSRNPLIKWLAGTGSSVASVRDASGDQFLEGGRLKHVNDVWCGDNLIERFRLPCPLLLHDLAQLEIESLVTSFSQTLENVEDCSLSNDPLSGVVRVPRGSEYDETEREQSRQEPHVHDEPKWS